MSARQKVKERNYSNSVPNVWGGTRGQSEKDNTDHVLESTITYYLLCMNTTKNNS